MKTVTVKGKVYQLSEPYRSVDDGRVGYLLHHHEVRGFRLSEALSLTECGRWYCSQLEGFTVGTITDAPIELEGGEWYMCYMGDCEYPYKRMDGAWFLDDGCKRSYKGITAPVPIDKMVRA